MPEQVQVIDNTGIPSTSSHILGDARWTGETITVEDVKLELSDDVIAELDNVADAVADESVDITTLRASQFEHTAMAAFAEKAKGILDTGSGVVLVDRLPIERYGKRGATACYWVLAGLIGRPVSQKWSGKMLYDVRDSGKPHGNGVRGSVTNVELFFHTDNSFGMLLPQYIGLLCLQTAKTGGESRLVNWAAVIDKLDEEHPELVARATEPFLFDRQAEHAPDAPKVLKKYILQNQDGRFGMCFSSRLMRTGYRMADQTLDAEGAAFLDAVDDIVNRPEMQFRMDIQRGQIQFINNGRTGHARSQFEDYDDPELKRHLLRIWLREYGGVDYDG